MARKRYITSEISSNEDLYDVGAVDPLSAAMWERFLTYLDDAGRGDARAVKIKTAVWPLADWATLDQVRRALDLWEQFGLICRYVVRDQEYLSVRGETWVEIQANIRWDSKAPGRPLSKLPGPPDYRYNAIYTVIERGLLKKWINKDLLPDTVQPEKLRYFLNQYGTDPSSAVSLRLEPEKYGPSPSTLPPSPSGEEGEGYREPNLLKSATRSCGLCNGKPCAWHQLPEEDRGRGAFWFIQLVEANRLTPPLDRLDPNIPMLESWWHLLGGDLDELAAAQDESDQVLTGLRRLQERRVG